METEIISIGSVFCGLGIMVVLFVMAHLFYQIARIYKSAADIEGKYMLFEEMVLDKVATDKGFDLKRAAVEREVIRTKTFRKRIQEEMIKTIVPKIDK